MHQISQINLIICIILNQKERSPRREPTIRKNNLVGGCRKAPEATAPFSYYNYEQINTLRINDFLKLIYFSRFQFNNVFYSLNLYLQRQPCQLYNKQRNQPLSNHQMDKSQLASTQSLQQRLQQQQLTIAKLKAEQIKLSQYVTQFKTALKRKQEKQTMEATKRTQQQEQKLQKQLEKQVENAKTMLKNYQHELRNLQKKALKNTYTPDQLIKVQQQLKGKQIQLKQVQQQIKDLKIVKRKQQKLIEKKQNNQQNDGMKLAKVVQEVRKQKELLQQLKTKSTKQQEQVKKKLSQISQLEAKYKEKCKQFGQTPMTFEEFKQKRKQKQRREELSLSKPKQKIPKKIITVKQMINNQYQVDNIEPTQKNLKQLKTKKQVAQNSLKLAQKKDQKQIQELKVRLQKLKEQNQLMQHRLSDKIKQKQQVDKTLISIGGVIGQQPSKLSKFSMSKKSQATSSLSKSHNPGSNATLKLQPINK